MTSSSPEGRHCKLIRLYDRYGEPRTAEAADSLVRQRNVIPSHAEFVEHQRNLQYGSWDLVYEHHSFEAVPRGMPLPVIEV